MDFVIFANCIIQEFIIIFNSKTEKFTTYPGGKHKKQKSTCRNKYFSHWGSRIRTCECSSQSAVSYRLTIPQYGDIIAYPSWFVKRFIAVLARRHMDLSLPIRSPGAGFDAYGKKPGQICVKKRKYPCKSARFLLYYRIIGSLLQSGESMRKKEQQVWKRS